MGHVAITSELLLRSVTYGVGLEGYDCTEDEEEGNEERYSEGFPFLVIGHTKRLLCREFFHLVRGRKRWGEKP